MSLESNNTILSSDFVSLKARVKAEMSRRKYIGSMTSYAGTLYDYTVVPASGGVISTEHINKLVTPVNAINTSGFTTKNSGDIVEALTAFDTKLKAHESQALYGATDCANSCSGLCRTACSNTCSGCDGCSGCGDACSSSCSGGCEGCGSGCNAACAPTCAGGCWNDGCTSNCTAACRTDCTGGCSGTCSGTCTATCANNCVGKCKGGCGTTARMTT